MPSLTDLARDERSARRLLSFVVTPNDEVTERLLGRLGAEDVVAQVDSDRSIPGMDRAEAAVWRDRIPGGSALRILDGKRRLQIPHSV